MREAGLSGHASSEPVEGHDWWTGTGHFDVEVYAVNVHSLVPFRDDLFSGFCYSR